MASIDDKNLGNESNASERDAVARQRSQTHDQEFELPDPEQVDRDIEQAERLYRQDQSKTPGGDKPTKTKPPKSPSRVEFSV